MTVLFKIADRLLQILFIVAISSVLTAKYNAKLRDFLKYGKTLDTKQINSFNKSRTRIVNSILSVQVPKVWFAHFYVLSLVLSAVAFTLVQLRQSGYQLLVFDILKTSNHGNISIEISRLVAFLIVGHSLRRLSETIMMMNYQRSKSKMNISHYLVGLFFYSSLNLQLVLNTNFDDVEVSPQAYSMTDLNFSILIPVLLFFLASSSQFLNHLHLSKLLKYTIPSFGMFKFLCCAHYFDEILIYVSIFALLQNLTSLLALIWVIVNLSVSSIETRAYYKKNGDGKVPKWCIIPFIL